MEIIATIFGYLLKFLFNICGNYGLAIILFSLVVKLISLPLTLKQQKSLKKSQELQPKLVALQEKYKDDQERFAQEYQKFMAENKYNPFGGCLPMILQIFVLLGIFWVVRSPMTYMDKMSQEDIYKELRNAIVAQDFSGDEVAFNTAVEKYFNDNFVSGEVDKEYKSFEEMANDVYIKDYVGNYTGKNANEGERKNKLIPNRYYELKVLKSVYQDKIVFLSIDLGSITSSDWSNVKLWIIPVLTVIFYYISLYMISSKQKKAQPAKIKDADGNEIEMPNMMAMNIYMPLLSGYIALTVPQGLGLYWFCNSVFQIVSQVITNMKLDKEKNSSSKVIESTVVEEKEDNKEIEKDDDAIKKPNNNKKKKKK